jgi:hypothetical protein
MQLIVLLVHQVADPIARFCFRAARLLWHELAMSCRPVSIHWLEAGQDYKGDVGEY